MPTSLQYMLMEKPGDREFANKMLAAYTQLDNTEIIAAYNSAWEVGIVGSHLQAVSYYALHIAFKKRFGVSPILIDDDIILSLTEPIELKGDSWVYSKKL
jgi:hypothetical protein